MTTWQRNTLIGLAGLLVVVLVLVAALPGSHHHTSKVAAGAAPAGPTTTTVDTAPPTTPVSVAPVTSPVTSEAPSTTAAPSPPTTTSPPPPTTARPTTPPPPPASTSTTSAGEVVDGKGAILEPPPSPVTKPFQAGADCSSLGDPGWVVKCGTAGTGSATLIWLVESRSGSWCAFVYRPNGPAAVEVLEARDEQANSFDSIAARVDDIAGDGRQQIAFGFHLQGSGGILAVDLVGGGGSVVVHREYGGGSARAGKGRLDGWGTDSPATGPYTHEIIEKRGDVWRMTSEPAASAPAGNL